jgi:Ca2+/H+ antiporter, TMEM165/GDT1 family
VLDAFLVAFGLIFVAELGDKSQLLTLALATRYPARMVLAVVVIATLLIEGAAVLVGSVVAMALPTTIVELVAGVLFLVFAVITVREGEEDDDELGRAAAAPRRWLFGALVGAFFVAELGDKTQLLTLTLASTRDPIGTWLGASAGMIAVSALAIGVGAALGSRLPERAIRIVAAVAFAVFGVLLIAGALGVV